MVGEGEQRGPGAERVGNIVRGACGRLAGSRLAAIDPADLGHDSRVDFVAVGDLLDLILHRRARQPDHPIAQRRFRRRKPVELDQPHQRPQGRRVDQQRDHDKAGRQYPHFRRQGVVLGGGRRQCQRDRAAQPAPQHHDLVFVLDRLGDAGRAQCRDKSVKGNAARHHRCQDQHRQQAKIHQPLAADMMQLFGRLHRGEQKDQRRGPEGKLLPNLDQILEIGRSQPAAAGGADRDRRGGHCDDAGQAEIVIAQHVDDVGRSDGHRHFSEPVAAQ